MEWKVREGASESARISGRLCFSQSSDATYQSDVAKANRSTLIKTANVQRRSVLRHHDAAPEVVPRCNAILECPNDSPGVAHLPKHHVVGCPGGSGRVRQGDGVDGDVRALVWYVCTFFLLSQFIKCTHIYVCIDH